MLRRNICRLCSMVSLLAIVFGAGDALAGPGSCDNRALEMFYFPIGPDGAVDRVHIVKVLTHKTPVYQDATSVVVIDTLNFNTSLRVLDLQGERVQVGHVSTQMPLGWVERSALLCGISPLKSEKSGLEQKLYIRTATEVRQATPSTVKAYPAPDLHTCDGHCRELSRFEGYFVFDIDASRTSYLLSETYKLDDMSQLVGWVSGDNGFIWDTAYGLRPGEGLVFPEEHEMAGEERTVCAYQSLDDAVTHPQERCLPILGGDRWYLSEHRIPILERIDHDGQSFYKVVLPLAGTGAEYQKEGGKIRIIEPGQIGKEQDYGGLQRMKHVDVLFLIDGTKSMVHHLDAIKGSRKRGVDGVVQQIMKTLQEDDAFQEAQFRFGFRIYRDTYAGDLELVEGLPLSGQCDTTIEEKERNLHEFEATLDRVMVTDEAQDDYAENLFGGIRYAIRDLAPCPENTKLLFILGDCGYDAETQRQRGMTPIAMTEIVDRLRGNDELKNIVTFFLQTPKDIISVNNPQEYERAYNMFTEQARSILTQIVGPARVNEIDKYLLTTDAADVNQKILHGVKQFSNTEIINELIVDLRGGTALRDAIQRLQGSEQYNNIPGLFWDLVEQGSCKQLGQQCQERLYDTVLDGYIPVSDDLVEDVWLRSDDLDTWISLLRNFDSSQLTQLSGTELRQAFVNAMKDGLEKVIRKPLYEDTGEPLKEYLKRKGGLPVSETSPLFRYSIADLQDPDAVPDCEINRLTIWVNNSRQMLNVVYHGDLRPVYTEEPFPGECPTGAHIPFISGDIQSAPLGQNPDMRYNHSFQKANVYWVPKQFLP